jgi:arsenate reductase (glutaredoxin)
LEYGGHGSGFHIPWKRLISSLLPLCDLGVSILSTKGNFDASVLTRRLAPPPPGCQTSVMLTVYVYQKCSTCRDALKWLGDHRVPHTVKAIRETPPTPAELKTALNILGGDIRKLFNTSGMDYRALGMKDKLPSMTETDAFELLSKSGNLVKRPFLIGDGKALTGFKPDVWEQILL